MGLLPVDWTWTKTEKKTEEVRMAVIRKLVSELALGTELGRSLVSS